MHCADSERLPFLRLDGSTPVDRRQQLVDRFNGGRFGDSVFLLSARAGGVGLSLVGASRLVPFRRFCSSFTLHALTATRMTTHVVRSLLLTGRNTNQVMFDADWNPVRFC